MARGCRRRSSTDSTAYSTRWHSTKCTPSDDDPREFVRAIEATRASGGDGTAPTREDLRPAGAPDGLDDTFRNVRPNVRLTFRLHMRNLMVPEQEFPQVFYLPVTVVGDGLVMRQLTVRVIVPEGPKHDD